MHQENKHTYYQWLYVLIVLAILVNFSGLFVTIIGPDGTFYASIAKTMALRHNYVDLFSQGHDFLDKPHFPFWVTAIFFEAFGFKTWAYKLPGILFLMMGAIYTYRFSKILYNKEIALWSVLILLTAEHIIISNNDVRAEPYLTGLIIASIYHLYKSQQNKWIGQIIAGSLFAAMAIMTKGMFAIIPICGAIAGHFILTGQWKRLFQLRWFVAIILTGVFILPEIYCLYQQFDLHPEKLVFGQHYVSGIRFFFWDSQFGRFFNTGPIKGSGDPFFFVHTLLWAFLPWSLLLFAAIYQSIKKGAKQPGNTQWYCLCGSLLTFLVFSASKFQLPYYLNIVFPLFAIQLAAYLYQLQSTRSRNTVFRVQTVIIILLLLVVGCLQYFFKPVELSWTTVLIAIVLLLLLMTIPRQINAPDIQKAIIRTVTAAFIVNIYLNQAFYPSLLHYQSGSEAAFFINQKNTGGLPVAQTGDAYSSALEFYLNQPLITIDPAGKGAMPHRPFYLYGSKEAISGLIKSGWHVTQLKSFESYWISMLKPEFLNYNTRSNTLANVSVVLVK